MNTSPLYVTLDLAHARDFLHQLYPNQRLGGLRMNGPSPGKLGSTIVLTVRTREPAERTFKIGGVLLWARHHQGPGLPESFGIDFTPELDAGRQRLMLFAEESLPLEATRYGERIEAALPVKISYGGETRKEVLADLSEGGAFVRTEAPLSVGTRLTFELRPPRSLTTLSFPCRVAWARTNEPAGMGVEFTGISARQQEKVQKLLAKLREHADA